MQQTDTGPGAAAPPQPRKPSPAALAYAAGARTFRRALAGVYADPHAARRALRAAADRDPDATVGAILVQPERYGAPREPLDPGQLRAVVDAVAVFGALRASRPRQTLREAVAAIRAAHAAHAHESVAYDAFTALADAKSRVTFAREDRKHWRAAAAGVLDNAADVYQQPRAAALAIWCYARDYGLEEAQRVVREVPEHFGALVFVERKRALGIIIEEDTTGARACARDLAQAVGTAARAHARRWTCREAEARVREATARHAALLAAKPPRTGAEEVAAAARMLAGMQWRSVHNERERRRIRHALHAMLPPALASLADTAIKQALQEQPRSSPHDPEHDEERRRRLRELAQTHGR
ncbi:MAG TPA: hypothetical protein VF092_18405 [Longimicrobium sp.]